MSATNALSAVSARKRAVTALSAVTAVATIAAASLALGAAPAQADSAYDHLLLHSVAGSVTAGRPLSLVVDGVDADGQTTDVTGDITETSVLADGDTDAASFSGAAANPLTLTTPATYAVSVTADGLTSNAVAVTVIPPADPTPPAPVVASIRIRPIDPVVAGSQFAFAVDGLDSSGTVVADVTGDLTELDLLQPGSTEPIVFPSYAVHSALYGSYVGTNTLTVHDGDLISDPLDFEVVAGPPASLSWTNTTSSFESGTSFAFDTRASDAQNDPLPSDGAVVTSTDLSDVVNGTSVTFGDPGTRTITVTLGDATLSRDVEVTPAAVVQPTVLSFIEPPVLPLQAGDQWQYLVRGTQGDGTVPIGPVAFTVTSPTGAVLAPKYVAAGADGIIAIKKAGSWLVTATSGDLTASTPVTITASYPYRLSGVPTTLPAGAFRAVLGAIDIYGNPVKLTGDSSIGDEDGTEYSFSAGTSTLTGTIRSAGQHRLILRPDGLELDTRPTVTVTAGPPASLVFVSPTASVTAAGSATYSVRGVDAYGNTGAVTAKLTSSSPLDTVSGTTVTFGRIAGARTLTATSGAVSKQLAVTVVAGRTVALRIVPAAATWEAGTALAFTVTGTDAYGNATRMDQASVDSSGSGDGVDTSGVLGTVGKGSVTGRYAGRRTLTATLGAVHASAVVSVAPSRVATSSISGPALGTLAIAGQKVTFVLNAYDRFGNRIDTSAAHFSSSTAGDVFVGHTVQFLTPTDHVTGQKRTTITSVFTWRGVTTQTTFANLIIANDNVTLTMAAPKTASAGTSFTVTVTIGKGTSGYQPTGSLRLAYDSKTVAVALGTASSYRVTVPGLARGKHTLRASYLPTGYVYPGNTTPTATVSVG